MKQIILILIVCVLAGCSDTRPADPAKKEVRKPPADPALEVVHMPPTDDSLADPPYPYMWYYRTEVHNKSARPLRIVWFEVYTEYEGVWNANNVLRRTMRGDDFSRWYTEGDQTENGLIPPGGVAVCDVNWHGSWTPETFGTKWAFIAVDDHGNDYFVEKVVPSNILKLVVDKTVQPPAATDGEDAADEP